MTFRIGLGCVAATMVVVSGCGSGGSDYSSNTASTTTGSSATTADASKPKDLKITMIAKSNNNPVFQSAKTGAEKAAADLSKSTGVNITVDWQTPETEDAQVQAQKIQEAVNNGSNVILLSCSDASKVNGAISDAVGHGVPVMTFDSDAPDSKRFAFYGANDEALGKEVMDDLAEQGKGQPMNVAILAGSQNAPNLQKRVKGAEDEAKKYPNIKIVGVFNHVESPQDASAEVTKDNNAHPEINAWAMVGGWALFNKSLLSLDPGKYKIVSVDALPAELAYIDKGIAPVLLAQPVYDWGYKSVGIIVDKLVLHKDVPTMTEMKLVKVTKDNLGDWARQLKDWGLTFDEDQSKYLTLPSAKKP